MSVKITKALENLLCKMFLCSNSSCVGRRLSRLKIKQCNRVTFVFALIHTYKILNYRKKTLCLPEL